MKDHYELIGQQEQPLQPALVVVELEGAGLSFTIGGIQVARTEFWQSDEKSLQALRKSILYGVQA